MASLGIKRSLSVVSLLIAFLGFSLSAFELQEGDLLFSWSSTGNHITEVTSGVEDLPIDHVAVVHRIGGAKGPLFVIEAVKPTVCLTPIDSFFTHLDENRVLVGRVNEPFDVNQSIRGCLSMVGKPYDDLYLPDDSAVYCSELVQMNYVTSSGESVFSPIPMSYHDDTGSVTSYWQDFYSQRGMTVPEGAPGTNPGELSRRPQVTIIGYYPSQPYPDIKNE